MKYVKNIAACVAAAIMALGITSCSTARVATEEQQMLSQMSSIKQAPADDVDDFVEVTEAEAEVKKANEEVTVSDNTQAEIVIDMTGSREKLTEQSHLLEAKYVREVEDVYSFENAPIKKGVNAGRTSQFYRDNNDSLRYYNAATHSVHKAEVVGYNVTRQHKLTGLYAGAIGGTLFFNHDVNLFIGAKLGYNTKYWNIYGWFSYADAKKNEDDVDAGGKYASRYYGVRAMGRIDLTPKGKLWDKAVLEIGLGISAYHRELTMKEDIEIEVPKGVEYEFEYDDTDYMKGGVLMPHLALDFKLRLGLNWGVELGGMFAPWTTEYHKVESTSAKGLVAFDAHVSVVYFFNKWKTVNPSVSSAAKRANKLQRVLDAY